MRQLPSSYAPAASLAGALFFLLAAAPPARGKPEIREGFFLAYP
jgi:hypothetical protein